MSQQVAQRDENFGPGQDKDIQQPLTLVMPIDFKSVDTLTELLQRADVKMASAAALDHVGTVHSTRFVILRDDEQGWAKIAVIAIYDGGFDEYIRVFARELGPLFNQLISFVTDEDKPPLPVEQHVEELVRYVAKRDVKPANGRTYSAFPDLTALDIYEATRPRNDGAPSPA